MSDQKPILIYLFDPLCGWCYGFSPVIRQLHDTFSDRFHFEVWTGGMVTGERVGPMGAMKSYIFGALPRLESTTGVTVSAAYRELLEEGSTISDSEPPSRAFIILKETDKDRAVRWGSAIQQLVYVEGKDLNQPESYFKLAEEAGLSEEQFLQKWNDPAIATATQSEFEQMGKIGVRGFPSLLLLNNNQLYQVAYGYRSFDSISEMLNQPELFSQN